MPFRYDESRRGYYLSDADYILPVELPPGRDELTALLLARVMLSSFDQNDVAAQLDALWSKFTETNSSVRRDLAPLTKYFTSESTTVSDLADCKLVELVQYAHDGTELEVIYKSPWSHPEPREYSGRLEHVHFSDGALYLLFTDTAGRRRVLNASFVKSLKRFDTPRSDQPYSRTVTEISEEPRRAEGWRDGFGVWSDAKLETITIRVLPPAADYYAKQRWHEDQDDTWEGPVLVRRMPGMVSPEVVRRVLSLGRSVEGVAPKELADAVRNEVKKMAETWE